MTDDSAYRLSRWEKDPEDVVRAYRTCCNLDPNRIEIAEWLLAITLAVVGIYLLLFPQSLLTSHMRLLTTSAAGYVLPTLCIWVGIARLVLVAKSVTRVTTRILQGRMILAAVSGMIWLDMVVAFFLRVLGEIIPPGLLMMFIVQVVGDFWLVLRIRKHTDQLRRKGLIT